MAPTTIVQNAWVVDDLDAAVAGWLALGVGPFFVASAEVPQAVYRGRPVALSLQLALAQAGNLQIELIRQVSDAPSAFRDPRSPPPAGLHHVCRQGGDYDALAARFRAADTEIVMEMELGGRIAFADTRATLGCLLEFQDTSPAGLRFTELALAAAAGWDGSDPVRALDLADLA